MAKYLIIPRVGDKKLPCVGHQLASCSLLISYVLNAIKYFTLFPLLLVQMHSFPHVSE